MSYAVVFGSCNADLTVYTNHVPVSGETVTGSRLVIGPGGKGANQATAAHRAGCDVRFICAVGNDALGEVVLNHLKSEQMDLSGVCTVAHTGTGSATIIVDENTGANRIVVVPGANGTLTPETADRFADVLTGASALLLQLETPIESSIRAAELVHNAGGTVILNPAPAKPLSAALLAVTDVITPNETEAETLTGISVDTEEGIRKAAEALLAFGPKTVIITLGVRGCFVYHKGEALFVPAFPVKAVDTTAAGDQFCGALAAALVRALPLPEAVRFASGAAALSVTRPGAAVSMAYPDEIEKFLAERDNP